MAISVGAERVGEVIYATSKQITAQSTPIDRSASRLAKSPALGSFVYVFCDSDVIATAAGTNQEEYDPFVSSSERANLAPGLIIGIVNGVQTSSSDLGRRPTALGISSEEELRRLQPQVFELLTTEFTVSLISFTNEVGNLIHRIPAKPPRAHSFVFRCPQEYTASITEDFGFLRAILDGSNVPSQLQIEDLAAAALYEAWSARQHSEAYLIRSGKAVLRYVANDYDRFQSIMRRLDS